MPTVIDSTADFVERHEVHSSVPLTSLELWLLMDGYRFFSIASAFIGPIFFAFQLLIITVYALNRELRAQAAYRIMLSLSINDAIELLIFGVNGASRLLDLTVPLILRQVFGSTLFLCAMLIYPQEVLLSINRIFAFSRFKHSMAERILLTVGTILCVLYFLGTASLFMTVPQVIEYNETAGFWAPRTDVGNSSIEIFALTNVIVFHSASAFNFFVYLLIIIKIMKMQKMRRHRAEFRAELRVFIVGFSRFALDMPTIAFVNYGDRLIDSKAMAFFVANMLWLLSCTVSAITTILCNNVVRDGIRELLSLDGVERFSMWKLSNSSDTEHGAPVVFDGFMCAPVRPRSPPRPRRGISPLIRHMTVSSALGTR